MAAGHGAGDASGELRRAAYTHLDGGGTVGTRHAARQFKDIAAACYLAWWDHWLTDHPAPLPQAKVTSYEMPSHGWQQYPTWPPADSVPVSWSPEADGTLSPLGDAAPDTSSVARFEANKERLTFDANATLEPSASHTHMQNKSDTMYS